MDNQFHVGGWTTGLPARQEQVSWIPVQPQRIQEQHQIGVAPNWEDQKGRPPQFSPSWISRP